MDVERVASEIISEMFAAPAEAARIWHWLIGPGTCPSILYLTKRSGVALTSGAEEAANMNEDMVAWVLCELMSACFVSNE